MISPWRVRLLGGLSLERAGRRIERFPRRSVALLLAALARHPGRHFGREELIELLFPEATDFEAARLQFRVTLSALRKLLEPPPTPPGLILFTDRSHVALLAEAVTTDLAELEQAIKQRDPEQVRQLFLGQFLPGFYEDWVVAEQERLSGLVAQALAQAPRVAMSQRLPSMAAPMVESALPLTMTAFFGREEESARLNHLLLNPKVRLITLLGPGGTGKTRLSIEVARGVLQAKDGRRGWFTGGIWFVELAALRNPAQVLPAVMAALKMRSVSDLTEAFRDKQTLLILDNLEQLTEGGASAVQALLKLLPQATLLCTTRYRLGLSGEHVVLLQPLLVPTEETLSAVAESAAVQLFCDRAQSVDPGFGLTERNAAQVALLVQQLNGVPLALEIAASWLNILSLRQIRERLSTCLALESRHRDGEERHRSLRAAIAWSVELLSESPRQLFAQLSVFRGGFRLSMLQEVCLSAQPELDLTSLIDHSLVLPLDESITGERRFTLLETIREYAAECLAATNQQAILETRLLQWMHCFVQNDITPHALRHEEWGNILYALELAQKQERPALYLETISNLSYSYAFLGMPDEGQRELEKALLWAKEHAAPYPLWQQLYRAISVLAHHTSNMTLLEQVTQQRLALAKEHNDTTILFACRANLALVQSFRGEFPVAAQSLQALYDEAARGEATTEAQLAVLYNYADTLLRWEKLDEAEILARQAWESYHRASNSPPPLADEVLAQIFIQQDRFEEAYPYLADALRLWQEHSNHSAYARALVAMARLEKERGNQETAEALQKQCLNLRHDWLQPQPFQKEYQLFWRDLLELLAERAAEVSHFLEAATLWGVALRLTVTLVEIAAPYRERERAQREQQLKQKIEPSLWERGQRDAQTLSLEKAVLLAETL